MTTPTEVQASLKQEFSSLPQWEERYRRIIEYGRTLPAFADENKIDANKLKGCQSNVWLTTQFENGRIFFEADSDASIVKGLVALTLKVYSGQTPDVILATAPEFLKELGLDTNLSQTRVNGLASLIKQIKFYAIAYKSKTS